MLPNVARTGDGGQTWELVAPFPYGAVFGLSYVNKWMVGGGGRIVKIEF